MRLGKRLCTSILSLICLSMASTAVAKQMIYIGAGNDDCIYSTVAYSICDIIEEDEVLQKDYACTVVHTSGSMANLQGLATRRLDLAIAQSDMLLHAIKGTSHFTHMGASPDLGVLLPLYPEPFSILVKKDSNINSLQDLRNKHINIGKPYDDQRASTELIMRLTGLSRSDFASLREDINNKALFQKLCSGKIDAAITMSGHPVVNYKPLMENCDIKLVPLDNALIKKVLSLETIMFPTQVGAGIYSSEQEHTQTFSAMSYLVASDNLDSHFSHQLLVALSKKEKTLRSSHPAMRNFSAAQTPYTKNLPLHMAAQIYFGTPYYYD